MRRNVSRVVGILAGVLWFAGVARAEKVDFARDVQPILVAHCYECHGPVAQKGKLRWDRRDSVLKRSEPVLTPGKADESLLIKLVTSKEEDEQMPPKGERLSARDVGVLRDWINQGADWPDVGRAGRDPRWDHWAFRRPVKPVTPKVKDVAWVRNAVDAFILARLEREGIKPSEEADRYALLRRVTTDLTGLPPTPAEVDAFINDKSPGAYERLVERLLASPAFGERWATVWLDLARYADSKGYAEDNARTIWRYRDWVVQAINENKPFDQFTVEQLAGDLLPNPTKSQMLATAFHRNTLNNDEGGTDDEEFRVAAVLDRVNTTMQVWMGVTIGCAQCHDHKYDPLSQREYYQLYAVFNQTEDSDRRDETPLMSFALPETEREVEKLEQQVTALEAELARPRPELDEEQRKWESEIGGSVKWKPLAAEGWRSRENVALSVQEDRSVLASGGLAEKDVYSLRSPAGLAKVTALRLDVLPDKSLPSQGPGRTELGNFVLSRFIAEVDRAKPDDVEQVPQPIKFSTAVADYAPKGSEVTHTIDNKDIKTKGWQIAPQNGRPHWAVYVAEKPVEVGDAALLVRLEQLSNANRATIGRWRVSVTDDPAIGRKAEVPADVLAVLDLPAEQRSDAQKQQVSRYYRASVSPVLNELRQKIATVKQQMAGKSVMIPVMKERPAEKRRKSHVFVRGNWLDKSEEVQGGIPAVFRSTHDSLAPMDRLALARWLVDPANPLTARVAVNRYWSQIFGQGLVETEDDFGVRSKTPSHPELLDWLALEFVEQGWDVKRMIRMMVTSAAYRQSSKVTREMLEKDAANVLLARGPRFRAPAEVVRDQALAVSGLLSKKLYGPPVKPPQPKANLAAAFGGSTDWTDSIGEDRYRRALYTTWRRSRLYPSMETFDAPNRQVCTLKRPRTNTPLQALVMLNDPVYVEAAQALGRRIVKEGGDTIEGRAAYAVKLCLGRPAKEAEVQRLAKLYEEVRAKYRKDPEAAKAMATEPAGPLPEGMERSDAAAWSVVGNVLLNLDEMVNKR